MSDFVRIDTIEDLDCEIDMRKAQVREMILAATREMAAEVGVADVERVARAMAAKASAIVEARMDKDAASMRYWLAGVDLH